MNIHQAVVAANHSICLL